MFRRTAFLMLTVLSFPGAHLAAQNGNVNASNNVPVQGVGHDYIKMLSETVDPSSGMPSVRIHVPIPPGRHVSLPFSFNYDANGTYQVFTANQGICCVGTTWGADGSGFSTGAWSYPLPYARGPASATVTETPPLQSCDYSYEWFFTDPSGGQHTFPLLTGQSGNLPVCGIFPRFTTNDVFYSADLASNGSQFVYRVADADETTYTFDPTRYGVATQVEDRNGNILAIQAPTASGPFSETDTLGRTVLSGTGFGHNGDTVTVSGLGGNYTVTWGTASYNWNAAAVPEPAPFNLCTFSNPSGSTPVVTAITLPNGQQYRFSYDPAYGLLSQITYPSGAWVKYSWGVNPQSAFGEFSGNTSQNGTVTCIWRWGKPVVLHRYVSFDGSTTALQQDFSYSTTWNPSSVYVDWTSKQTTVTSTPVNGTAYATNYIYAPAFSGETMVQPINSPSVLFDPNIPVEQMVTYYKDTNTGGTPLRTVNKTWISSQQLFSEQTTLDNGLTALTAYAYGPGGQVTEKDEYGYGQGAYGPLARKTVNTYQAFSAAPNFPTAGAIFDKPCKTVVSGGNNNPLAETDYLYDGGTTVCGTAGTIALTGTGSYTSHDEANYGPSATVPRGNLTKQIQKCFVGSTGCTDAVSTFSYDETGQLLSRTNPCGNSTCADVAGGNHTTTYSYSDSYTVLSGGGNTSYTPPGNTNAFLTSITNPLGQNSNFTYDFNNGQLTVVRDPNSQSTAYLYNDAFARPTQIAYPDGGQTQYAYNDTPFSISVTTCQLINGTPGAACSPSTLPPGWKTNVTLMDGAAHIVQAQLASDPEGADLTDTSYDGMGRVHSVSNPYRQGKRYGSEGTTSYVYDALGRVTTVVQPDGTPPTGSSCPLSDVCTSYSGNTTLVTDEAGNQRKNQTDGLGRLTAVWEAPNVTGFNLETDYQYDALDNLLCVVQKGTDTAAFSSCASAPATWRPRSFGYDSLSRLLTATNPESGSITYSYDANSNLANKIAPHPNTVGGAVTTNFAYDALNRLITKSFVGVSVNPQQYAYDGNAPSGCQFAPPTITPAPTFLIGRRSSICDGWGTDSSWSYDSMGRVLKLARNLTGPAVTKTVGYAYNLDGSLRALTYPSGNVVSYAVSGAGRTTSVSDPTTNYVASTQCNGCAVIGGQYTPEGNTHNIILGKTTSNFLFTYDFYNSRLQRTTSEACCDSQGQYFFFRFFDFKLGSGDNGNLTTATNSHDDNRTQNFTYDPLNRITQAYTNGPNWGETFTTDAWGNMWSRGGVTGKTLYEPLSAPPDVHNRLTGFSYSAAGNLIKNGSVPYSYDAENHLSSTAGWTYTYNNDGERVRKASGSTGTVYWGGGDGNALAESDLNGNMKEEYIFFNGKRVARRDLPSGTVHYYFSDDIGSTSVVTSATGVVEEDLDYYPYGGIVAGSVDNVPQNYKFNGKERDAESGLDNFGARYDASTLARFMTPDWAAKPTAVPYANFGNPQSLNLYSYVENNPTTVGDPDGHGCDDHTGATSPDHVSAGDCAGGESAADAGDQAKAQNTSTVQKAEGAVDWFNGTLGFGKSNCAGGGSCVDALGMAGTAILTAVVSDGASEEGALARSETKIANLAKGLAKEGTLEAAEREANGGMKVAKTGGTFFEHAENYVKQHIGGLDRQASHLERFIREHPGLSDSQKERAISAIRFARDTADAARTIITPKDPI